MAGSLGNESVAAKYVLHEDLVWAIDGIRLPILLEAICKGDVLKWMLGVRVVL
jgi:hypothetical protein